MTIQEQIRRDARWLVVASATLASATLAAADRIDALEAALLRIADNSACAESRHVAREALEASS